MRETGESKWLMYICTLSRITWGDARLETQMFSILCFTFRIHFTGIEYAHFMLFLDAVVLGTELGLLATIQHLEEAD